MKLFDGNVHSMNCAARDLRRRQGGYTLIELVFVVFIIALVLSIAMPRLMPAMMYSQLEGSARHLANYGRSAVAYSAMNREPITVRFDLAKGEYWCLKWLPPDLGMPGEGADLFDEEEDKQSKRLSGTEVNIQELLATGSTQDITDQSVETLYQLDLAFRRSLEAQAKNVPRQSILGEFDPLFEKEFTLEKDEEEQREEVSDSLLDHGFFPEGIVLESVLITNEEISEGIVDVEVSPLGLAQGVSFFLKGTNEQYYTVAWDPITGGAHLAQGKAAGNVEE